ncbi:DUF5984 family protein [Paenibacillus sp. YIM B09110]|uniref:DUF5984 family protein n=1 Tax=Paenibacillus sp. YIM B09110 TaxID=3126102 RepID=UPI00301CE6BA
MIHFKLKEIKDISPWGSEGKLMLHWFALTDSYYWFKFGDTEFPKYTKEINIEFNQANKPLYIDYQFARFFWDISEILRHVESPVPDEIFEFINSVDKLELFQQSLKDWLEISWDESEELNEEIYDEAREWLYVRKLDFGYLVGGPELYFIRNNDRIHIYWIANYKTENGVSFWQEARGEYSCNYYEFIEGLITSFKSFGIGMHKQISRIFEKETENVEINREQILINQNQFDDLVSSIESKKMLYAEEPDWKNILNRMKRVLGSNYNL